MVNRRLRGHARLTMLAPCAALALASGCLLPIELADRGADCMGSAWSVAARATFEPGEPRGHALAFSFTQLTGTCEGWIYQSGSPVYGTGTVRATHVRLSWETQWRGESGEFGWDLGLGDGIISTFSGRTPGGIEIEDRNELWIPPVLVLDANLYVRIYLGDHSSIRLLAGPFMPSLDTTDHAKLLAELEYRLTTHTALSIGYQALGYYVEGAGDTPPGDGFTSYEDSIEGMFVRLALVY